MTHDLIERLQRATGADALLDDDLGWLFSDYRNLGGLWREHRVTGEQTRFSYSPAPTYTASLDAALALVNGMPGVMWRVGHDPADGSFTAELVSDAPECTSTTANHDIPAIALLIALLRMMAARPNLEGK